MHKAAVAIVFALSGALILLAGTILSNVWAGSGDSSGSTYVEAAVVWGVIALPCLVLGIWLMRER